MSAWIVSRRHIAELVDAAVDLSHAFPFHWRGQEIRGRRSPKALAELGEALRRECVASVSERYKRADLPGHAESLLAYGEHQRVVPSYGWDARRVARVAKLLDSYEYQSCEHAGFEGSAARDFCTRLRVAILQQIPEYGAAPWDPACT